MFIPEDKMEYDNNSDKSQYTLYSILRCSYHENSFK